MSAAEALARKFHDTYETLAPQFGYETRLETREFDPTSPNGRLMIAVCQTLIDENRVDTWQISEQTLQVSEGQQFVNLHFRFPSRTT